MRGWLQSFEAAADESLLPMVRLMSDMKPAEPASPPKKAASPAVGATALV